MKNPARFGILLEGLYTHLKSNAIAVACNGQTLGLGMGQVNRVDAVEHALSQAQSFTPINRLWSLASDAFFPFPTPLTYCRAGVKWVIQPGGSIRDDSGHRSSQRPWC